ncbi:hypothetical protein SDC9_116606 [bioreactor metagenome]|uniref:Uncharacterized protein n=1 Tax=bioreactor metagenome TaxID=1076179 RepID=A0A645BX24_9ZZZZ
MAKIGPAKLLHKKAQHLAAGAGKRGKVVRATVQHIGLDAFFWHLRVPVHRLCQRGVCLQQYKLQRDLRPGRIPAKGEPAKVRRAKARRICPQVLIYFAQLH